jgi:predicted glycoside hydrolase/deacetylase ChbG (UPF0249 family)
MIKLIVNADDFGYSRGINHAIIDCHQHGIVNSATMMMNMPGITHAVELAKANPKLMVGIHLVLTCGKPLLKNVSSLVDQEGNFKKLSYLRGHVNEVVLEELEREWSAQIDAFLETGLSPSHFDSHHHTHTIPEFLPVVQRLSRKYGLSCRQAADQPVNGVPAFTDVLLNDFYGPSATDDYFDQIANNVQDGATVEVMCHPGYVDQALLTGSSYAMERVRETEILTTAKLPSSVQLVKERIAVE